LGDRGALGQDRPPLGRRPAITRFIGDDPAQPRLEWRAGAKTAERVVGIHECLLGRVFRVRGVTGDLVGDPKRQLLVLLDKCFICVDIAVFGSFDERYVVQWPALHGSIAIPSYQQAPPSVPVMCLGLRDRDRPLETPDALVGDPQLIIAWVRDHPTSPNLGRSTARRASAVEQGGGLTVGVDELG